MARRLKDVKVDLISILTDETQPSNRQKVIVKSDNSFVLECEIEKEKTDCIKGILYATAMKALYEDTDKEYYENEDVEKAAHEFMKAGIENKADNNHNFKIEEEVFIVESYIEKKEDGYEWKVAFDISKNEKLMEKAKEGLINGVSIAGKAKPAEEKPTVAKEMTIGIGVEMAEVDTALEKAERLKVVLKEIIELQEKVQLITQKAEQLDEPIVESVEKIEKVEPKIISLIKTEVKTNE